MNTLSIEQYLKEYVKNLSTNNTDDLSELLNELSSNQRLAGPLVMYALFCGYDPKLRSMYPVFFGKLDRTAVAIHENMPLERDCAKVLRSYVTKVINQGGGYFPDKARLFT